MKNRLKQLREERHLSQEKLASKIGLTGSSICFFETGKREPHLATWEKIASCLGVSVPYLLGYEDIWYQAECLECGKVLRVSQSDADELTCCPFCKKFYFSMSKVN